jgi:UDP-N-acetylmuramoyl-tripeptide--D-alanyl-D-alanine ligase
MSHFDPTLLAKWSKGEWKENELPQAISGFCFDARQLQAGECFVALSGGARDGHEFIAQAAESGAAAVLVEQAQPVAVPQLIVNDSLLAMGAIGAALRHRFNGPVIGITGSCGKTSTKEMLRLLLGTCRTHATAGNWNNRIGVPMTLFGLNSEQQDFAVIEAGINQPGEMVELGRMIEADLSIVTNIASAHLELLGSLDQVAVEKAELLRSARPGSPIVLPNSVFQYPVFAEYADRAWVLAEEGERVFPSPSRVIRYQLDLADVGLSTLSLREGENVECYQLNSPSVGICMNGALAIIAARELGISATLIRTRLREWQPASNRGRIVGQAEQTFYIDCYNANPASMQDALQAFCRVAPEGQARCYVLGAMNELGAESVSMHRSIGRLLQLGPHDQAYFVGPEILTTSYLKGTLDAGADPKSLQCVTDVASISSAVAEFSGTLFLKGSRSYALEQLLPVELR